MESEKRFSEEMIQHLLQPEDGRKLWRAVEQLRSERDEARREAEKWRKRAHEAAPNNTIKIWPDPLHPWEESAKVSG